MSTWKRLILGTALVLLTLLAVNPAAAAEDTQHMVAAPEETPGAMHKPENPCNPCGMHKPENPCNPCGMHKPENPCNPCGMHKPENPCNPCGMHKPENPCNPCGMKKPVANPCGGMALDPALIKQPEGAELNNGGWFFGRKQLVTRGEELWTDTSLSTNGLSCNSCHMNNMQFQQTFTEDYPHAVAMASMADLAEVNAAEMVQLCMVVPMAAKPLAWDSEELAALAAYTEDVQQPEFKTYVAANVGVLKAPENPCAMKKPGNPCNPCAMKKPENPCNPCAMKKPHNPCEGN